MVFLLFLFVESVSAAPKYKGTANEIKAAYIYNFALFTTWPASAFSNSESQFVIAVLGEDPLGSDVEKSLGRSKVGGRAIKIIRVPRGGKAPECQILYVSASEKDRVPQILEDVRKKPILTVADFEPFCRMGGCIRFERAEKSVGLVINRTASEAQGLKISSDLLAIAQLVESEPEK
jgi:hypothetical protein